MYLFVLLDVNRMRKRMRIRTITTSLLLLFCIGCESTTSWETLEHGQAGYDSNDIGCSLGISLMNAPQIDSIYQITGPDIEVQVETHRYSVGYPHSHELQWSSSYRIETIYEGMGGDGNYSGEVEFTDPLENISTATDSSSSLTYLTFQTSWFLPIWNDIVTIYCEYYDEDGMYHSDSLHITIQ